MRVAKEATPARKEEGRGEKKEETTALETKSKRDSKASFGGSEGRFTAAIETARTTFDTKTVTGSVM